MAIITLTDAFSILSGWPGNIFDAADHVSVETTTATTFAYTFLPGAQFEGYTVTAGGTGFSYLGTTPSDGVMQSLVIADAGGQAIFSVTGIDAASIQSDLGLLASVAFGWTDPSGGGAGPNQTAAWSMLMSGNDIINGTAGDDKQDIIGLDAGDDVYNMGAGNDRVSGGIGNDTINGGDGFDRLSFDRTKWSEGVAIVRGATINMATGVVLDPYGYTDHITSIEEVYGSVARDTFIGGATSTIFAGLRGADTIIGGTHGDIAMYDQDTWSGGSLGIIARLGLRIVGTDILGTIRDGFGSRDHTVNIFNVSGTKYDDSFYGNARDNTFTGGEGKDIYFGGLGDDQLNFNATFTNTVQHGISVDLRKANNQIINDGFDNIETARSIEDISGSNFADRIIGTVGNNVFRGCEGDDTMKGGGGADTFEWNKVSEIGANDIVTDFFAGAGLNHDTLKLHTTTWGGSTTLHLEIGSAATSAVETILFDPVSHKLYWDIDGNGAEAAVQIVTLQGVTTLTVDNFLLV